MDLFVSTLLRRTIYVYRKPHSLPRSHLLNAYYALIDTRKAKRVGRRHIEVDRTGEKEG